MEKQKQRLEGTRGQGLMGGLFTGFIMVAAALFLIVVLVYIFGSVALGFENTKVGQSVTNESGWINSSGYTLASGIPGSPRDFAITTAINGSSGQIILAGNYTISSAGSVTNQSTQPRFWQSVNFTYGYNNNSASISNALEAGRQTDNVIPLIGVLFIVIAVGLIVTVLVVSLIGRKRAA